MPYFPQKYEWEISTVLLTWPNNNKMSYWGEDSIINSTYNNNDGVDSIRLELSVLTRDIT